MFGKKVTLILFLVKDKKVVIVLEGLNFNVEKKIFESFYLIKEIFKIFYFGNINCS